VTARAAMGLAVAVSASCAHLPASPPDREQEERRYQASEQLCREGELAVCLDLAESDLRGYGTPGSFPHGDVAILRRARGRFVRLCDEESVAEACLRLYHQYDVLFEGRPGPRSRAAYGERACALGLDEGCRPPATIGRPTGPARRQPLE